MISKEYSKDAISDQDGLIDYDEENYYSTLTDNPDNPLFERIKNQTIDKTNGNVTITVTYFEIYILLDKTKVDHYWLSESSTFFQIPLAILKNI